LKELKSQISGDTFNNSFNSGGGQQIIAQGTGAIGQQVNYNITQQVSVEELLKLLQEIKGQLPEKAQMKLRNEMKNEKSLP
jgi:endo-beta-N-acetylglucosaminidase D